MSLRTEQRVFVLAVIAFIVVVRLVFSGLLDLLPEEAYYWNYSQHLDIGYLDHPPMVAWLTGIITSFLGHAEWMVRLSAFICWVVVVVFMARLSENLIAAAVVPATVLLLSVLPIYFSIGFLMTPDAPLYACWAGALYFLERALVAGRRRAWIWAGLFIGLGMLSKYTMGLVALAALAFMATDAPSRKWFIRPEPYLAAVVAFIIFLPVVIWNYQHDWASFAFQSTYRWIGAAAFSLHQLIGSVLVLLTPIGALAAVRALITRHRPAAETVKTAAPSLPALRFMAIFTLVPLAVFVLNSLRSHPKLNWTGPVWLAVMPLIALTLTDRRAPVAGWVDRIIRRGWKPTIIFLSLFYPLGLCYIVLGTPGYVPSTGLPVPTAWEAFAEEVERVEESLEKEGTSDLLIVGLDQYWIASELSYYDRAKAKALDVYGGKGLTGGNGLMWDEWLPMDQAAGKNVMLVSFSGTSLDQSWVTRRFAAVSDIQRREIRKGDRTMGYFFWRLGRHYQLDAP
jgi:dolichol-phosphate mannosyltransferase